MKVSISEKRGVTILALQGKITIGAGEVVFRDAIYRAMDEGKTKLVLDMAGVTALDSDGISDLANTNTAVSNRGGALKLINLPPKIHELLAISKLITVLEVYDNEADAVDSFG